MRTYWLGLALCVLFAACVLAYKDPNAYAENPKKYHRQHLSYFTDQFATFYVLKRDYKTETNYSCLSATRVRDGKGNGNYMYRLGAKFQGNWSYYEVPVQGLKTGSHRFLNAANYTEDPNEGPKVHRIMATNYNSTCFVVTVPVNGTHGCFILMREDQVKKGLPWYCDNVYNEECGDTSVILYTEDGCKDEPPKKRPY